MQKKGMTGIRCLVPVCVCGSCVSIFCLIHLLIDVSPSIRHLILDSHSVHSNPRSTTIHPMIQMALDEDRDVYSIKPFVFEKVRPRNVRHVDQPAKRE